jgi:hypothetical protein
MARLQLLGDVRAELFSRDVRAGFAQLGLELGNPDMVDHRQDRRRAWLQTLTQLSKAIVVKAGVVELGNQPTQCGATGGRRQD